MTRTAAELAGYLGAKMEGNGETLVDGVASPELARGEDLIYLDSSRHLSRAKESASKCVLVRSGVSIEGKTVIEVNDPKFAFAKAALWLSGNVIPQGVIHATAIVAASAKIAPNVRIGPYVVIEEDVEIGSGTMIEAFSFLGCGTCLGENCRLHPRVTLYAGSKLGDRVELHSGVVIGGDGFGYVFGEGHHLKFPQMGSVRIGNDVEIGCNTTIDRGSLGTTEIHAGVKIDNLVQVAHNVQIGENSILVAQTGISGSSSLGKHVLVGGQAGLGDHCTVEDGAIIGGQAGILPGKRIRRGRIVWGTPARPLDQFKEQFAHLTRLPELAQRVNKLEREKETP